MSSSTSGKAGAGSPGEFATAAGPYSMNQNTHVQDMTMIGGGVNSSQDSVGAKQRALDHQILMNEYLASKIYNKGAASEVVTSEVNMPEMMIRYAKADFEQAQMLR